ncbi:HD-GYP domain-containing protein [uncultured Roseovarius sp.]|uniref:HD-GYP domain-containing protein n=1 Tax=uncultured Roseovarius sp. TaxID=293344 RepID=UPI002633C78B|nr:HD domain-containing protein [uncultured Roseovarius sp.]
MQPHHHFSTSSATAVVRLGEILGALSHALDLTEGQPEGHCVRCCWIGMQVAEVLDLTANQRSDLYFTLLLKDLGCSSNAARICQLYLTDDIEFKRDFKLVDGSARQGLEFLLSHTASQSGLVQRLKAVTNVLKNSNDIVGEVMQTRCDRGAEIARMMRFSEDVAQGIAGLDEHWDGGGRPARLRGEAIPLYSRIALLAQVADVFVTELGVEAAVSELTNRAGTWFDPDLTPVFIEVMRCPGFLEEFNDPGLEAHVFTSEPAHTGRVVDEQYLDEIASAFAQVIDAKSPFTHGHSERVAQYTDSICAEMGYSTEKRRWMARAALLHDIGKLGVSNTILDKPGKLTDAEFDLIKLHPAMSHEILSRVSVFQDMALTAAAHHERLDGKGYPNGMSADQLTQDMRILSVADIFDALTADRPYRPAMPLEKAYAIMDDMVGCAIDIECYAALQNAIANS